MICSFSSVAFQNEHISTIIRKKSVLFSKKNLINIREALSRIPAINLFYSISECFLIFQDSIVLPPPPVLGFQCVPHPIFQDFSVSPYTLISGFQCVTPTHIPEFQCVPPYPYSRIPVCPPTHVPGFQCAPLPIFQDPSMPPHPCSMLPVCPPPPL